MSSFIGGAQGQNWIAEDDWRLDSVYSSDLEREHMRARTPFSYRNQFWPGGSGFLGDETADCGPQHDIWYRHWPDLTRGRNSRYGVVGVTRDAFGSPLGNATVKLFRTADDLLVNQTTSDPSGNYVLSTPYYPDTHWVKVRKTASPDVQGVTIDTLIAG